MVYNADNMEWIEGGVLEQNINHSTTYDIEQLIVLPTLQEEICY